MPLMSMRSHEASKSKWGKVHQSSLLPLTSNLQAEAGAINECPSVMMMLMIVLWSFVVYGEISPTARTFAPMVAAPPRLPATNGCTFSTSLLLLLLLLGILGLTEAGARLLGTS